MNGLIQEAEAFDLIGLGWVIFAVLFLLLREIVSTFRKKPQEVSHEQEATPPAR